MKLVILESPYAPKGRYCLTKEGGAHSFRKELVENIRYARLCMRDCLMRGEAPFASHLLYAQEGVLDDTKPNERQLGITAGFEWARFATLTVVYTDLGISKGMKQGIQCAESDGRAVEFRTLPGWDGWKAPTETELSPPIFKPVPMCEMRGCNLPATHQENWHEQMSDGSLRTMRYWCDGCTPWSGHYEHHGKRCDALVAEINRRLFG